MVLLKAWESTFNPRTNFIFGHLTASDDRNTYTKLVAVAKRIIWSILPDVLTRYGIPAEEILIIRPFHDGMRSHA